MPLYMQEMIMSALKREDNKPVMIHDRTPNPFTSIAVLPDDRRYSTLSGGVFEEVHDKKQFEQYGRFTIDTEKRKIIKMESENNFEFLIDPVVFAWSVDPLSEERVEWSPYNAFRDNPILNVDPDGALDTEFKDKDGKTISKVDDGSNAVFQLTGTSQSDQYFAFKEYDQKLGGNNEVVLQTVIDFTQDYTREKYVSQFEGYAKEKDGSIKKDANGKQIEIWNTHCNQGTFSIAKSVNSALEQQGLSIDMSIFEGKWGALKASEIYANLGDKYEAIDRVKAQDAAKKGAFVVGGWSSHAFTLNNEGIINNVGAPRAKNNLWDPQYNVPKATKFYIIYQPEIKK